jgi:hypothetical protein
MSDKRVARFTREELHRLVWEKPMRTLAQEFGVSDVGLAKMCRKAKVPVPARGYWAKLSAGKVVRTVPLPALDAEDRNTPRDVELRPTPKPELPDGPVAEQIAFEARPENRVEVAETLRNLHPLVRTTLDALERSTGSRNNGYLGNWQVRHLDVEVSKPMLKRAIRIMDAVIKAFELRGWEVTLGRDDRNSYVTIFGQRIPFGIREPRRQVSINPSERRSYDPSYREEPSGILALVLREYWGRSVKRSIGETESRPLEDRINDYIAAAVALAHERAEWKRRQAEAEEQRKREERTRQEERQRREAEIARTKALEEQADRWHRSRMIYEYLAAVRAEAEARGESAVEGALAEWLEWAGAYAQYLDPRQQLIHDLTATARVKRATDDMVSFGS